MVSSSIDRRSGKGLLSTAAAVPAAAALLLHAGVACIIGWGALNGTPDAPGARAFPTQNPASHGLQVIWMTTPQALVELASTATTEDGVPAQAPVGVRSRTPGRSLIADTTGATRLTTRPSPRALPALRPSTELQAPVREASDQRSDTPLEFPSTQQPVVDLSPEPDPSLVSGPPPEVEPSTLLVDVRPPPQALSAMPLPMPLQAAPASAFGGGWWSREQRRAQMVARDEAALKQAACMRGDPDGAQRAKAFPADRSPC